MVEIATAERGPPAVTPDMMPPAPAVAEASAVMTRWGDEKKAAFRALAPAALCLVATDGPTIVTVQNPDGSITRYGHNAGTWPVRLARTDSWKDQITQAFDRGPFFRLGVTMRVWLLSKEDRDRLAASVADMLAARADEFGCGQPLRNEFLDLGADTDLTLLEADIHGVARRLGLIAMDDDGLSLWLDQVVETAGRLVAANGYAWSSRLLESVSRHMVKALGKADAA